MNNMNDTKKIEIVKLSSDLFFKNGLSNTTISEIAYLSNVTKDVLHKYFKTKDDLVNEYIKIYFETMLASITIKLYLQTTNKNKILFLVQSTLANMIDDKKFLYLYIEFLRISNNKKNENSKSLGDYYYEKYQEIIYFYICNGVKEKEFIDCNSKKLSYEIISKIAGDFILFSTHNVENGQASTFSHINSLLDSIQYKKFIPNF